MIVVFEDKGDDAGAGVVDEFDLLLTEDVGVGEGVAAAVAAGVAAAVVAGVAAAVVAGVAAAVVAGVAAAVVTGVAHGPKLHATVCVRLPLTPP